MEKGREELCFIVEGVAFLSRGTSNSSYLILLEGTLYLREIVI